MEGKQVLTRRRFLVTALGVSGGLGLVALAGCSSGSAPAAAPAATSAPAAAAAPTGAPAAAAPPTSAPTAPPTAAPAAAPTMAPAAAPTTAAAAPTSAPAAAATAAPAAGGKIGGSLSYLGFEGDDAPDAAKPFYDKYSVTLGTTYLSSSEDILTKLKAGGPGKYDVGTSNTRLIQSLIDQDFLEPLDAEKVPHLKDIYPDFTDPKIVPWAYRDGKLYGIAGYFGLDVINYNADKIPSPPTKWDGLLDPQYKGRIAITDSGVGNLLSVGTAVFGYPPDGTQYTKDQLAKVVDWMKKLKANSKTYVSGYGELADLLIRGDVWIGFIGWEYISVQGQKAGVNIKHFLADGPLKAWCDAFVVFKGANNPDTAYAWVDNMITAETAAKAAQHTSSLVTNPKVVPLLPKDFVEAMGFNNLGAQLRKIQWSVNPPAEVSDPSKPTIDDFKHAWDEIKAS